MSPPNPRHHLGVCVALESSTTHHRMCPLCCCLLLLLLLLLLTTPARTTGKPLTKKNPLFHDQSNPNPLNPAGSTYRLPNCSTFAHSRAPENCHFSAVPRNFVTWKKEKNSSATVRGDWMVRLDWRDAEVERKASAVGASLSLWWERVVSWDSLRCQICVEISRGVCYWS